MTIERKDFNENYCPENCYLILRTEQRKFWAAKYKSKMVNNRKKELANLPLLTDKQYEIIWGSLLGDGSLHNPNKTCGNYFFNKTQTSFRKEYLEWHHKELCPYSNSIYVGISNGEPKFIDNRHIKNIERCIFSTFSHPIFTWFRKLWYPDGIKIIPKTNWNLTPLMLAVWYQDDGYISNNSRAIFLATDCFTKSDCELLQAKLLYLKISSVLQKKNNNNRIAILAKSYDRFIDLVTPFIHNCFLYKIKRRLLKRSSNWDYFNPTLHEAFGEQKRLCKWANDKRCKVSRKLLYQRVVNYGWKVEKAMVQLKNEDRPLFEAFGENKRLCEWVKDNRCMVSLHILTDRINKLNWNVEKAIVTPKQYQKKAKNIIYKYK